LRVRRPPAAGRLRYITVGIERSTFHPLEIPQLIEESFDRILATTAAITDPFEQAFFVMVQIPYLQPFDDVNKRVSRLASRRTPVHCRSSFRRESSSFCSMFAT
jgi:hypothetical protein